MTAARVGGTDDGIRLVAYDPEWPAQFADEAARIHHVLGPLALRIDHHGSTSIPGLSAKPIIDIQVSIAALVPLEAYAVPLEQLGYSHLPHPDDAVCPFFYRPANWPHTHHVHVVEHRGIHERRTLAFRDYLREHDAEARAYERLKQSLAERFSGLDPASRDAYARAKGEFVERIVALAIAGGYARPVR